MKRKLLILITVCSMLCLVACGAESNSDVNAIIDDETTAKPPVVEVTAEPTTEPSSEVVEATAEPTPTEEPVAEVTPEPTEVPSIVYEGIDMDSDLNGMDWIETFIGIIDEPKVVVYSSTTGRKEIVEKKQEVVVNPDNDVIAIYLPDGYEEGSKVAGLSIKEAIGAEHSTSYILESEETRNNGTKLAALYYIYNGEETRIVFTIIPE